MAAEGLSIKGVCDRYGVSRSMVNRMRKDGKLIHGMAGNSPRFSVAECDKVFLGKGVEPCN
jgi:hypothetical protein